MEANALGFTIIYMWLVVLIGVTALSRALFIINPIVKETNIKASIKVEGVRMPEREVAEYIRKALLYMALAVGFSLAVIILLGMIILLQVPEEMTWAGLFVYLLVPILVMKAISALKVFDG